MVKIDPWTLARERTLFALKRLPSIIQSDVLSDGAIAERFDLGTTHPVTIGNGLVFDRSRLFNSLQKAADRLAVPSKLEDARGKMHATKIVMDGDDALLAVGKSRIRLPLAALLTTNSRRRKEVGAACLARHTLSAPNRKALQSLVSKAGFTHEDFMAVSIILAASPEAFVTGLRERAQTNRLSRPDFLPADVAYWDNPVVGPAQSLMLKDFVEKELTGEREDLIMRRPTGALERISLSFAAPELVPIGLLEALNDDVLLDAVRRLTKLGDPFALVGAFDLCIARMVGDARFADAGETILDTLFADPDKLSRKFMPYSAAFIFATTHLATHQVLQRRPVYWRRLAAAAHAALVARTLGEAGEPVEESETLLAWAMRLSGQSYYLSVLNDSWVEPRWRPDWIVPSFLVADVYGRASAAKKRVPEDVLPASWDEKLKNVESWIDKERLLIAATYPAIGQGTAPVVLEKPVPGTPVGEAYDALVSEPTIENFLALTPIVWAFGLLAHAHTAALAVIQSLRSETKALDPGIAEHVLELAAFIAATARDNELGELVSQVCVERAVVTKGPVSLLAPVAIMLECSAADVDRERAIQTLAKRLENLAFVSSPEVLDELMEFLRILRELNESLGNLIGRAIATARLGRSNLTQAQVL